MKDKLLKLLATDPNNWGSLIIRIPLGLAFLAHGWGKLFAEGNPEGFAGWLSSLGAEPAYPLAILTGVSEAFGGILIIIGLLVRFSALTHVILMLSAIFLAHLNQPMFGQGSFELQILMLASSVMLLVQGGGRFSLDCILSKTFSK